MVTIFTTILTLIALINIVGALIIIWKVGKDIFNEHYNFMDKPDGKRRR